MTPTDDELSPRSTALTAGTLRKLLKGVPSDAVVEVVIESPDPELDGDTDLESRGDSDLYPLCVGPNPDLREGGGGRQVDLISGKLASVRIEVASWPDGSHSQVSLTAAAEEAGDR